MIILRNVDRKITKHISLSHTVQFWSVDHFGTDY